MLAGDVTNSDEHQKAKEQDQTDRVDRAGPRAAARHDAKARAAVKAVAAGAAREQLRTVEVEDFPLAYLPGNALRVRVRVVGPLADRGLEEES